MDNQLALKQRKGGQPANSPACIYIYTYIYIYMHAVKLGSGPILGILMVRFWPKLMVRFWPKLMIRFWPKMILAFFVVSGHFWCTWCGVSFLATVFGQCC